MTDERFFDMLAVKYANRMAEPVIQPRKNINALRPGPRTPEGKAASSRNSLTHGLTARTTVIPGEDQAEFDALCQSLIEDRKPEGELEIQLTGEIAASTWRLARARQHEAGILEVSVELYTGRSAEKLELVMRYAGAIERQLNRTIVRLENLQAQRRKTSQIVSQPVEKPAVPADREPAPEPQPAAAPEPLVMVAGSAQPQFVSQSVENTQPTAVSDSAPKQFDSHPAASAGRRNNRT